MRSAFATAVFAAVLFAAGTAQADQRIFLVANDGDGYGVDRCLAESAACGAPAANAYCRAHDFDRAASYRKIDRDDITVAIQASARICHGGSCDDFVAIECTR